MKKKMDVYISGRDPMQSDDILDLRVHINLLRFQAQIKEVDLPYCIAIIKNDARKPCGRERCPEELLP